MKQITRKTALLLALVLLLGSVSMAGAEGAEIVQPDFAALIAAGEQESEPGVILLSDPVYYAERINWFEGRYAEYLDAATGNRGVIDCNGRILCRVNDPRVLSIQPYSNGVCMLMINIESYDYWLPFTVYGERLGPDNILVGQFSQQCDWATGEECFIAGELRDVNEAEPVGDFLLDAKGHYITGQFGLVYNGALPYAQNGKWGLRDLDGNVLVPYGYANLSFVDADTLLAQKFGAFRLIDRRGATVAELTGYTEAESLAPDAPYVKVRNAQGLWGLCDATGNPVLPCVYQTLSEPHVEDKLYLFGQQDGQRHFLSPDGVDIPIDSAEELIQAYVISEDCFVVGGIETGFEVVNGKGELLLETHFAGISWSPGDDWLILLTENRSGIVYDLSMRPLLDFQNTNAWYGYFEVGATDKAVYCKDGNDICFYSREDGSLLHRLANTRIMCATQRYVIVYNASHRYAMADAEGKLLTDYFYTGYYNSFNVIDGLCQLKAGNSCTLLDYCGTELLTGMDTYVQFHPTGNSPYATYMVNGKYGFLKYRGAGEPLFVDVEAGKWYTAGADFCAKTGLMNGVGGGKFAPQKTMTRAMLVQVLYNLSGSECAPHGFTDVPESAWYYNAVNWAAANGIVNGKSATRFAPNDPVTREQTVTILYRYAQKFGELPGEADALAGFADADQVSGYAKDAMGWAIGAGIVSGVSATQLAPLNTATRAQLATILMRFVQHMAA